ncbi:hypothetical protein GCM10009696_00180 [Kocuria himachalensis]
MKYVVEVAATGSLLRPSVCRAVAGRHRLEAGEGPVVSVGKGAAGTGPFIEIAEDDLYGWIAAPTHND